jgi:NCS1 family nucleobase:cation symporter-1
VGYSALLGPVGGIMIADYFVCRRTVLDVPALYDPDGSCRFTGGWSLVAVAAFLAGVLPSLPGFLAQAGWMDPTRVPPLLLGIYGYAWFSGFAIAFVAYLIQRKMAPNR